MSKLKSIDDCVSGRDYLEFAQREGWEIRKNGSYYEIEKDGVLVRWPDCARALPKQTRGLINTALVKAGLVVGALLAVVAWVVF
jgi:hypothetical protein